MTTHTQRVQDLIDLVAEEHIAELHVRDAQRSIRVLRHDDGSASAAASTEAPTAKPPAPAAAAATAPVATVGATHTITAPMAGSFYRAASAGGDPLVSVGMRIAAGTQVAVVEAMKILNEVTADRAATVVQVLCENGQDVDQGQALFVMQENEDA